MQDAEKACPAMNETCEVLRKKQIRAKLRTSPLAYDDR